MIRIRMIFFESFSRKERISQQLSPEDPPKIVGHLGGQPRHGGFAQALGVSPGGVAWWVSGVSPGRSARRMIFSKVLAEKKE